MTAFYQRGRYAFIAACLAVSLAAAFGFTVAPDGQALKVQGPDTIGNALPFVQTGGQNITGGPGYINGNANNAAAANNVSIPAQPLKFSYLTGFTISGGGATAASFISITITNVSGGPMTYQYAVPAGATVAAPTLDVRFNPPLVATALNTAVTVNVPSFGAGNTNASANCYGFTQ